MRHNSPRVQVGPVRKPSEIRPSVSLSACRLFEFTAKAPEMRAHRTATAAPPHYCELNLLDIGVPTETGGNSVSIHSILKSSYNSNNYANSQSVDLSI